MSEISKNKDFVDRLLAFSMCSCKAAGDYGAICLILDNLDTLDFARQLSVFLEVHDTINSMRRLHEIYKQASLPVMCKYFSLVVPMRPETRQIISNAMGQTWPFVGRTYHLVDMSEAPHPNSFDLSLKRIKNHRLFSDANIDEIKILIKGIYESGGKYQPERTFQLTINEPSDFIENFIIWLRHKTTGSDRVASFTGRSIRRQLQFTFKVIGHPTPLQAYVDAEYMGMEDREVDAKIWDAMWDFCQPIGHGSPVEFTSFMLNPYRLITDQIVRHRSPLIGLFAIMHMTAASKADGNHAQYFVIEAENIINHLREMSYSDDAIILAIKGFTHAGILIPRKDQMYIDGSGCNMQLYSNYFIDAKLLSEYHKIIFFIGKSHWKSGIYYTHCYRHATKAASFLPYYAQVDRLDLQEKFLRDIINAEKRLKSNMLSLMDMKRCISLKRKSVVGQIGKTWVLQMQTLANELSGRVSGDAEYRLGEVRAKLHTLNKDVSSFSDLLFI
ncbi:hypothetical protein CU669_02345 [Paramagnetospirillum kuznetsovii]|uniref:Uncharacterized protein n=2 Tax=Paramagnetospirillum kuznetsovii TaxID=2053833 RepID=A0A364P3L2_9PROT|nr:hypothetical protein CU669_02345 [Paramagnetospirillum kuznetsovii]